MSTWAQRTFPDEWLSAYEAALHMKRAVAGTPHARSRHWFGTGLPLLTGAVAGVALSVSLAPGPAATFTQATMTLSGLFAGFALTLMLFTGRVDGSEILDYEATLDYAAKVRYLLWSQLVTLAAFGLAAILAIAWTAAAALAPPGMIARALLVVMTALFTLGLARAVLLPYQIYELHSFSLDALVKSALQRTNTNLRRCG